MVSMRDSYRRILRFSTLVYPPSRNLFSKFIIVLCDCPFIHQPTVLSSISPIHLHPFFPYLHAPLHSNLSPQGVVENLYKCFRNTENSAWTIVVCRSVQERYKIVPKFHTSFFFFRPSLYYYEKRNDVFVFYIYLCMSVLPNMFSNF
jgi:hypothetical protein